MQPPKNRKCGLDGLKYCPLTEIQGFDIYNIGENNAKTTCKNNTI